MIMLGKCFQRLIIKTRAQVMLLHMVINKVLLKIHQKNNLEFDENKKKETLEHDFENHYKKSFMKTYEEDRLRHKIIIRK